VKTWSEEEKKKWSEEEKEWHLNSNFGYPSVAFIKPNERQPKSAFRAPLLCAQTRLRAPQQKFAKNERQASCTETCKATIARQAKNKRC
jgi:hypothetical protein